MKPTRIRSLSPDVAETVRARILKNSLPSPSGCIEWSGGVERHGYGRFTIRINGKIKYTGAHRAAWLAFCGDIPGDLVIDHVCRNRLCVNIKHLRVVTNAQNVLTGYHGGKMGRTGLVRGADRHTCGKHGNADGYIKHLERGKRVWVCRICRRARNAAFRARQRQSA